MSVYIPAALRRQVRARFAECCAYCRTAEELSVAIFEFEHVIPRSKGGETNNDNVCFSCPTCNRWKADRTVAWDADTKADVPLFHPWHDAWLDHFNWNEDATTILGLTPIGRATIALLRMNRPQLVRARRIWVMMGDHPPMLD